VRTVGIENQDYYADKLKHKGTNNILIMVKRPKAAVVSRCRDEQESQRTIQFHFLKLDSSCMPYYCLDIHPHL